VSLPELTALLEDGVRQGIFPSAQASVIHRGAPVLDASAGGAGRDTLFDLASLTKVICTTPLFLSLWAEGKVGPQTPLSRTFPESPAAKAGVTFEDLLFHRSGFPAFVPYFARAMPAVPELFTPGTAPSVREEVRQAVVDAVGATRLRLRPRQEAVYSDVGFILLGESLARLAGKPLDTLFTERVARPLGLGISFRRLSSAPQFCPAGIAPTGRMRPREPAPGQEKMWPSFPSHASEPGEVDDDNAWVMDGVAGHAGLFGTAADVARFGQALLEELEGASRLAPAPLWRSACTPDKRTPGSTRALGFDTPSEHGSSAGRSIGKLLPGAVGHTGFTGVSLWIDLARKLVVALCTNRTFLGRGEVRIRDFRPTFHDRVVETIELGAG
jgi:serine-type D-Ala-D-Ala carboxypeptidase